MARRHQFTITLLCFLTAATTGLAEEGPLVARFLDEAPKAWDDYSSFARRLMGSIDLKLTREGELVGEGKLPAVTRFRLEFKHNDRCGVVISKHLLPDSREEVIGFNPAYSFQAKRKNSDLGWALFDVAPRTESEPASIGGQTINAHKQCRVLVGPNWFDLSTLVRLKTFQVIDAKQRKADGEEMVEVQFDNSHPIGSDTNRFCSIQGGKLLLDPGRYWCVRQCTLQTKYSNSESIEEWRAEFEDGGSEYPIPKRLVQTGKGTFGEHRPYTTKWEVEYDLYLPEVSPEDSLFKLAAFGLPEPFDLQQPKPSPTNWWLWAAVIGGGCVVLGLGTRWYVRRRWAA